MKCVFCGGNVKEQTVQEEVKAGKDHILVTVKAEVCENCHERYYSAGTVDRLSVLGKGLKAKKSSYKEIGKVYEVPSNPI